MPPLALSKQKLRMKVGPVPKGRAGGSSEPFGFLCSW